MKYSALLFSALLFASCGISNDNPSAGTGLAKKEIFSADQFRAAVAEGDFKKAKRMKALGTDIEPWRENDSGKQLCEACYYKKSDNAIELLDLGARVDWKSDWRYDGGGYEHYEFYAIHFAVCNGDIRLIKQLLAHGASIECTDKHGWTPLHVAAWGHRPDVVKELIRAGASLESKTKSIWFFHYWGEHGFHPAAIGAGSTPLNVAVAQPEKETIKILLAAGADPLSMDAESKSALYYWPELRDLIKQVEAEKRAAIPSP
jgi:ankyrin repeat protein